MTNKVEFLKNGKVRLRRLLDGKPTRYTIGNVRPFRDKFVFETTDGSDAFEPDVLCAIADELKRREAQASGR